MVVLFIIDGCSEMRWLRYILPTDLLLYVNGLPLVMIELKNATEKVKSGYDGNLKTYQRDIPQLFWYNAFVCISNGIQTRVGAFNAPWEHFFSWTKLKDTAVTHEQLSRAEVETASKGKKKRLSCVYQHFYWAA